MRLSDISSRIDHTVLKPITSFAEIRSLCSEALKFKFASVCVPPTYIGQVSNLLKDQNDVRNCTVISFPFGYDSTLTKITAIENALDSGADEIDVVTNVAEIKNGNWQLIDDEIKNMVDIVKSQGKVLKIIFETCYLTLEEKTILAEKCVENNVDYLKTSTGFGTGGATIEDIKLMKSIAGNKSKVKASGGIRTLKDVEEYLKLDVERIGASAGVAIMEEAISNGINA